MNIKVSRKIKKGIKGEVRENDYAVNMDDIVIEFNNLNLWYEKNHALKNIELKVRKNKVTAIIGPSGCGKTSLIRCINRMNDVIEHCKIKGAVKFHGKNIYGSFSSPIEIRKKIGMIFQKPNPFPMSIYDNVAYGPKVHKIRNKKRLNEVVEKSLKRAVLWDEVEDRLRDSALGLSGGQQQRLCIARALAIEPEILLMDEPTASLDPIATTKIEELILELKKNYTVVCVTHNMQQAARISDYTAFMYLGELIEFGETEQVFESPKETLTENYITGRFG